MAWLKALQTATDVCRPFVLEEFGLSYRYFGEEERKVVVAVVADAVIAAKRAGRPLMGAMLWNAAFGGKLNELQAMDDSCCCCCQLSGHLIG